MLYESDMATTRKPSLRKRPRAKTGRVPRAKIPDRSQMQTRVPKVVLARFDDQVSRSAERRADPNFNRTDAVLEAMALWIAADAAKGGAQ